MVFVDGVVLSQRHRSDEVRELAGLRTISYRAAGDVGYDGGVVASEEVLGERFRGAWIRGSHGTALQVASQAGLVSLKGNPGRFGRPDNLFNLDLFGTVQAANAILSGQGLPGFQAGVQVPSGRIAMRPVGMGVDYGPVESDSVQFGVEREDGTFDQGCRVWSLHLTQNYECGTFDDARAVLNWLDGQTVARVKKQRLGEETVIWGSLKYAQTEAYLKGPEMLAHAKGELERQMVKASKVYQYCMDCGVIRIEVKCAKDYLREKGLTWLATWGDDMSVCERIFRERTTVLDKVQCDLEEFDVTKLPSRVATTAEAWLRGADVRRCMSVATMYRHAAVLDKYGIDIRQPRNVLTMPIRVRTVNLRAASVPDWYQMRPALRAVA